jgi:hypothetical protein
LRLAEMPRPVADHAIGLMLRSATAEATFVDNDAAPWAETCRPAGLGDLHVVDG